jgi:hypothetical protein
MVARGWRAFVVFAFPSFGFFSLRAVQNSSSSPMATKPQKQQQLDKR